MLRLCSGFNLCDAAHSSVLPFCDKQTGLPNVGGNYSAPA
jgi:hypothetical protein